MRSKNTKTNECAGAKTSEEIAWAYGIHVRTLMRRLEQLNIELPKGAVLPKDQKRIYEALGLPKVYISPLTKDRD